MKSIRCYQYSETMEENFPFKILKHKKNYKHELHSHEYMQLCYILKGRCQHTTNGVSSILVKGDFFSIPPFMEHEMNSINDEVTELVIIDFMPFFVNDSMRSEQQIRSSLDYAYLKPFLAVKDDLFPRINLSSARQTEVEELIGKMSKELTDREMGFQFSVKADLLKMLITVGRELERSLTSHKAGNLGRYIYEAIDFIKENYNQPICLEDVARVTGVAPTYFSNLFRDSLNKPFIKYLNEMRIRSAMDMLKESDYNITEIGMSVGYNHLSHFNRMFKQVTGLTPTEYRKHMELIS